MQTINLIPLPLPLRLTFFVTLFIGMFVALLIGVFVTLFTSLFCGFCRVTLFANLVLGLSQSISPLQPIL